MSDALHIPIMVDAVLEYLDIQPGQWYLDGTFGRGGHTRALLAKGAQVIGLDQDPDAIEYGKAHFAEEIKKGNLLLISGHFEDFGRLLSKEQLDAVRGALFDLGTSTDQLLSANRGFSITNAGPLDMRMDPARGVTAKDLLMVLPEAQLAQLFFEWGGEPAGKKIARSLVAARTSYPEIFNDTGSLADYIETIIPRRGYLHPATKVFQALRIAVNSEIDALTDLLDRIPHFFHKARIVILAFHEGEDRPVKQAFKQWETQGKGTQLTQRPLEPTAEEITANPRSRSTKFRAFSLN